MQVSRRTFLKVAAGGVAATGAGVGGWLARSPGGTSTPGAEKGAGLYRSCPDLRPPVITVDTSNAPTAPGYILLTPGPAKVSQRGLLMADGDGAPVWFSPSPAARYLSNLQVQRYGGEPVLAWFEGELVLPSGYGRGEYVLLDSRYEEVTRVRGGRGLAGDLHEFLLTPEGTALFTAYRARPYDLSSIGGSRDGTLLDSYLQEVDVATGKVLFEWQASKHVALSESYMPLPKTAKEEYDFFHINSIDVDDDGDLLVSGRHTWAVYKVDRSNGSVIWRLHGKRSDFTMGKGASFYWQHHVRHHPGGVLTVFDDGAGIYKVEHESRGIALRVDTRQMTATLLEQYLPHPEELSSSQGSVEVLPDGNVFVGWGSQPYFSEYKADGTLLYVGQLPKGVESYRAFKFPWVGQPKDRPAIAADRDADRVTVYASWNGSTDLHAWQVLAGPEGGALEPVGVFPRAGFETVMTVRTLHSRVAASAQDRKGRLLGQSDVVLV